MGEPVGLTTIPERLAAFLERNGYVNLRRLPTGEIAGVCKFMFTTGLVVGLTEVGWRTRFCYERSLDAIRALETWDGQGFPPGYWIKQKPEEVQGPGSKFTRKGVELSEENRALEAHERATGMKSGY